jgi:single-strand DNA-binding protein
LLNKIILIGRLTRDPELRYTGNGIPVANFSLAVDRPYKNQQGERDTDFIRIVVWRKLAEVCANNIGKGRLVAVEGSLQVRSYEDKEGNKRQISEVKADTVKFLDWPKGGQAGNSGFNNSDDLDNVDIDLPDDDVPF